MLKWIESTGKSEEAAIEAALQKLGMDRDEVSVEVLERAKSGFLGIGSCPAKVKVTYEAPAPVEEKAPVAQPVQEEK
ncbi:Jag N-terminal domain-containing protein, partial [Flavonifractor plautii]